MSEELKEILEEFSTIDSMRFKDSVTVESINKFEDMNKITFPEQLKEWLSFSDGGEFYIPASFQLYGIEHKPLINVDDEDRPSDDYIVIGALSSGDPVLFKKGSQQIVIYNHEMNRIEDDEIYEDFYGFLRDLKELLGVDEE